ncbi:major facilitator superfamily transporter [Phaeosphaeria sp. MPI-PUGE-AT-0046c]|nr:major facilitator superfamily transporter [Phaeosphaeria sp. MPI-PUGE-AT-0046c]
MCIEASSQSFAHIQGPDDSTSSRGVNRKMDIALLPFLSLLYLFNGLDRSNIGNAETQGFSRDIGASPDDLNLAVSLFSVTFVLFQLPSAAMGRWLGAKRWIIFMMIGWGTFTIAHAFVRGRSTLIAVRLMIGTFEAAFYPTAVAYLSCFYCRYDLAVRLAIFYGQYAIAGAFSGSIAFGVFHLKSNALYGWQCLFIIEGTLTVIMALIAWFWLPHEPASAWFLAKDERQFAAVRIIKDNFDYVAHNSNETDRSHSRLSKRDVIETMVDWNTWYVLVFNICASVPNQTFSVFLPLVVQGLDYSAIEANLMSVPPYICGATGLYLFALSSDYRKERGYHIVISISISLIGLLVTVMCDSSQVKHAGLCILLFGSYVAAPLTVAWLSGNIPKPGKRSLVLGVNGFGNLAGIIGSQLYRKRFAPEYLFPFYVTLGFVAAALLGYIAYRFTLAAVNKRKRAIMADKSVEQIYAERIDSTRYADSKWTFLYGL